MKNLFLFLLISFSVSAHDDCVNCGPVQQGAVNHNLEEFSDRLEHWSADPNQVMAAPCKNKTLDMNEVNQRLASLTGNRDRRIGGVRFNNESPELLDTFRKLTQTGRNLSWFERLIRGGNQPSVPLQQTYNVNPECDKVLCAVDKIWGRDVGRKLLYLHLEFGYNGSELVQRDSARYTDAELDDILLSLKDLPKSAMPLGRGRPLVKSTRPHQKEGVVADAEVRLYSLWFGYQSANRHYTLYHEYGHNLHSGLSRDLHQQWSQMSSWVKLGDKWEYDVTGACMVSRYGMTSPYEDFAEVASAYRYNARALLKHCPQKYEFMRTHVFRGVEYREESQCSGR